jgi:hypothetical protein
MRILLSYYDLDHKIDSFLQRKESITPKNPDELL